MSEKQNTEIEKALEAVRNIRKTVKGNMHIVRPLFLDRHYLPLCWAATITMGLYTVFLLLVKFTFADKNPSWLNTTTIIFFVLAIALFTIWKAILIARYAKEDGNSSLGNFLKLPEISNLMFDCTIIMITLIILSTVLGMKLGSMWIFLPCSFVYFGVTLFLCGNMYSIVEYRIFAIITFAIAIIIAIFMKNNHLLWFSASYTVYLCFLSITMHISGKVFNSEKDL